MYNDVGSSSWLSVAACLINLIIVDIVIRRYFDLPAWILVPEKQVVDQYCSRGDLVPVRNHFPHMMMCLYILNISVIVAAQLVLGWKI